jgi:acyl-coenzyme A thioesterase PaaI-like protein
VTTHATTPWADEQERRRDWEAAAAEQRGGAAYGELIAAQRLLQDRVAGAVLPHELMTTVTAKLSELATMLADYQAPEAERWDGWRADIPGRAMPLLPPYVIDERGKGELRGRVTFTRFYLGGNAAAHGGSHALLFDDVMGHLSGQAGGMSRTASLTVNYRRITPLDVELTLDCRLDSIDGRKRFISARLYNPAGEVVADSDGMFLRLLPGQQ